MRVFEEDDALALVLQHQFGNLRIAAQRAAEVTVNPRRVLRPAARPGQLVQAAARRARGHAPRKPGQHIEVLAGKGHHFVLERIVGDHRQRLAREIEMARHGRVRRQTRMDAFDLHPLDGAGQRRNERPAMRDALPLERKRLRKNRRRVHGIDQVDRAVERRLAVAAFGHARNQLHQAALAAVRVADQAGVTLQHALAHDRIMGAPHRVQLHAQLADGGRARTQPGEQGGIGGFVVQTIGGQAKTQLGSGHR